MEVREIREQSFCWQDRPTMALLRACFPHGEKRTTAVAIYQVLTELASERHTPGEAETPVRRICEYAGVSESTAKRYLRELERIGVVRREQHVLDGNIHLPNTYQLVTPTLGDRGPGGDPLGPGSEPTLGPSSEPTPCVPPAPPNTPREEQENNNKAVVDALHAFGITRGVAEDLVSRYDETYVWEKIDQATYLLEHKSPQLSRNPAGYLRRAIEQDYPPPEEYRRRRSREVQLEGDELLPAEREDDRRRREREAQREAVLAASGAPIDQALWSATEQQLAEMLPPLSLALLTGAVLVSAGAGQLVVVFPTKYAADWAAKKLYDHVARTVSDVAGHPYSVTFSDYASFLASATTPTGSSGAPHTELLHRTATLARSPDADQPAGYQTVTGSATLLSGAAWGVGERPGSAGAAVEHKQPTGSRSDEDVTRNSIGRATQ